MKKLNGHSVIPYTTHLEHFGLLGVTGSFVGLIGPKYQIFGNFWLINLFRLASLDVTTRIPPDHYQQFSDFVPTRIPTWSFVGLI